MYITVTESMFIDSLSENRRGWKYDKLSALYMVITETEDGMGSEIRFCIHDILTQYSVLYQYEIDTWLKDKGYPCIEEAQEDVFMHSVGEGDDMIWVTGL